MLLRVFVFVFFVLVSLLLFVLRSFIIPIFSFSFFSFTALAIYLKSRRHNIQGDGPTLIIFATVFFLITFFSFFT